MKLDESKTYTTGPGRYFGRRQQSGAGLRFRGWDAGVCQRANGSHIYDEGGNEYIAMWIPGALYSGARLRAGDPGGAGGLRGRPFLWRAHPKGVDLREMIKACLHPFMR